MTAAANGWPDPDAPGVPRDADREGWHWIARKGNDKPQLFWRENGYWWHSPADVYCVKIDFSHATYHGPVTPPAEVEVLRRDAQAWKDAHAGEVEIGLDLRTDRDAARAEVARLREALEAEDVVRLAEVAHQQWLRDPRARGLETLKSLGIARERQRAARAALTPPAAP